LQNETCKIVVKKDIKLCVDVENEELRRVLVDLGGTL
jgi:hypothetical protein